MVNLATPGHVFNENKDITFISTSMETGIYRLESSKKLPKNKRRRKNPTRDTVTVFAQIASLAVPG